MPSKGPRCHGDFYTLAPCLLSKGPAICITGKCSHIARHIARANATSSSCQDQKDKASGKIKEEVCCSKSAARATASVRPVVAHAGARACPTHHLTPSPCPTLCMPPASRPAGSRTNGCTLEFVNQDERRSTRSTHEPRICQAQCAENMQKTCPKQARYMRHFSGGQCRHCTVSVMNAPSCAPYSLPVG